MVGPTASSSELPDLLLQLDARLFEYGAMTAVSAALQALHHAAKRKLKALRFPLTSCLFPRQARFSRAGSLGSLVLLQLHGFAFPAPGHPQIIAFPRRRLGLSLSTDAKGIADCLCHSRFGKGDFPEKRLFL